MPTQLMEPAAASDRHEGLAARPELAAAMMTMLGAIKANRRLPDRLVELMRLRVAYRNQCRPCMSMRYGAALADGLTEDMVCSLERPQEAENLGDAEKAAIAYADRFAVDHLGIAAELADLHRFFDSGEIAEMAVTVACFVALGRLAAVFDDGASLPVGARNPNGAPLAPWNVKQPLLMA